MNGSSITLFLFVSFLSLKPVSKLGVKGCVFSSLETHCQPGTEWALNDVLDVLFWMSIVTERG